MPDTTPSNGTSPNGEPLIGRTLAGRFRVTGYIGEGGMAAVYRGVQDGDGRNVAIKVMNADLVKDRKFVRRFRREAKAASMLKHPNTVEIVEFGVDGDTVYLAMECIEGLDLAMVLERDRRLTEARAASVLIQVCAALSVAHAQNIVHRDLKPDNIMITAHPKEKGAELVKVLDFGIAKILDEDEGPMPDPRAEPQSHAPSLLTRVGTIVGTPAYMSPEQGRAEKVDGRTDLYACGVLLYELVTGRTPFGGETPMQVVMRHVNEPPLPPRQWVEIHPGLEQIIMKALMKWPAERQQSAEEMARALKAVLPELATTKRPLASQSAGPSPSVVIGAGALPAAAAVASAGPAPSAASTQRGAGSPAAGAPAAAAPPTARGAPGGAPPATAPARSTGLPGRPPPAGAQGGAASDDDDDPSTLVVPDAAAFAPPAKAADKKLVFPTLNIDLPEDLEKAGMSGRAAPKAPTLESPAPRTLDRAPPTEPSPPPSADEDDDARTLIAQPRPPTGPGPRIDTSGGGLALAQTLASELGDAEIPIARPRPAAGVAADPARRSEPALTSADDASIEPAGPARGAAGHGPDHLGLGGTLPLDQAGLERVLTPPPQRAAMASLSEGGPGDVSSPGASPEVSPPERASTGAIVAPAAPRKGLSVAMAMVLGALIGAIVVGAIVVALVSMR